MIFYIYNMNKSPRIDYINANLHSSFMSLLDSNFTETDFVSIRNTYELFSWESPIMEGFETVPPITTETHRVLYMGWGGNGDRGPVVDHVMDLIMDHLNVVTQVRDRHGRMRMDRTELCAGLLNMFEGFLRPETMAEIRKKGIYVGLSSTETDLYYVIHINKPVQIDQCRTTEILFKFHLKKLE